MPRRKNPKVRKMKHGVRRYRWGAFIMAFISGFFGMELVRDFLTCWTPFLPCLIKMVVDYIFILIGVVFMIKFHVKYKEVMKSA